MAERPVIPQHIGDADGLIHLRLNESSALGLLSMIPDRDGAWAELNNAIKAAYEDDGQDD